MHSDNVDAYYDYDGSSNRETESPWENAPLFLSTSFRCRLMCLSLHWCVTATLVGLVGNARSIKRLGSYLPVT